MCLWLSNSRVLYGSLSDDIDTGFAKSIYLHTPTLSSVLVCVCVLLNSVLAIFYCSRATHPHVPNNTRRQEWTDPFHSRFSRSHGENDFHTRSREFSARPNTHTHTYTLTTPQANTFSPVARRHSCVYVCTHIARAHVFPQRHRIYTHTHTHTISTCSVCINIWWCIANTSIDCSSIDKANTHSTISSVSVQCSATTYIIDTGQEQPVVPNNKHTYKNTASINTLYITYIQHIYIYIHLHCVVV